MVVWLIGWALGLPATSHAEGSSWPGQTGLSPEGAASDLGWMHAFALSGPISLPMFPVPSGDGVVARPGARIELGRRLDMGDGWDEPKTESPSLTASASLGQLRSTEGLLLLSGTARVSPEGAYRLLGGATLDRLPVRLRPAGSRLWARAFNENHWPQIALEIRAQQTRLAQGLRFDHLLYQNRENRTGAEVHAWTIGRQLLLIADRFAPKPAGHRTFEQGYSRLTGDQDPGVVALVSTAGTGQRHVLPLSHQRVVNKLLNLVPCENASGALLDTARSTEQRAAARNITPANVLTALDQELPTGTLEPHLRAVGYTRTSSGARRLPRSGKGSGGAITKPGDRVLYRPTYGRY